MRMTTTVMGFAVLWLAACSSEGGTIAVAPTEVTKVTEEVRDGYTFIRYMARQPAFRDRASDEDVEQRIYVGIPDGVETDAPVVFRPNEQAPASEGFVAFLPEHIDLSVVTVVLEHRGYGESLSSAADQTLPEYVSRAEAVEDIHGVVSALREIYTGPWFGLGVSYAGGLILQYVAKYPDDLAGVVSQSGVVERSVANPTYDPFTRELLGEQSYLQVVEHIENLEPEEMFDDNWVDREFLEGLVAGLTQYDTYQSLLPPFKNLVATRTTEQLIIDLRELDQAFADGQAAAWGRNRSLTSLTREEALRDQPYDRYYLWQQCTDIGEFRTSGPDGIWQRDEDDWDDECRALFGVGLVSEIVGHRQDVSALEEAGIPLIFVSGGKDPWSARGLEVPSEGNRIDQQERWSVYETS